MFQIAVIIYSAQKKLIAVGRKQENEGTKEKTAHRRDGCVKGFCYIGSCPLPCNAGAVSGRLSRSQYVFSTVRISDL